MEKSFDVLWAPWRKPAVVAAVAATVGLFLPPPATPANVTYTSSACTSFVVSGTPPNQTLTCSGGGAVPTCSPTANPPSPAAGQATTITANCSNQPLANGYVWTGAACVGLTGASCNVNGKAHHTSITYSVSASNAAGTGPPASITVSW